MIRRLPASASPVKAAAAEQENQHENQEDEGHGLFPSFWKRPRARDVPLSDYPALARCRSRSLTSGRTSRPKRSTSSTSGHPDRMNSVTPASLYARNASVNSPGVPTRVVHTGP